VYKTDDTDGLPSVSVAWQVLVSRMGEKIAASTLQQKDDAESSKRKDASAVNRTRGPSMATMDFTTKPLMLR